MTSKKKAASKLALAMDQAKVQATDLQDRIGPAVGEAKERLTPVVSDARDRLGPAVADARDRLTPVVEDARERLTPVVGDAKERLADLAGTVAVKLDETLPDKAVPAAVASAAAAKRSGSGRLKKLFVLAGVGAAAAFIAKRLRDGGNEPQWQSTPPGRPTSAPAPSASEQAADTAKAPAAAVAGMAAADAAGSDDTTEVSPTGQGDDAGGGSPDEAAADAVDTPREPTTPDAPAEKIEVKE
jgi:hypothetical protein